MSNVAVIGCGVIGLTSALEIQRKIENVKVTIFADKFSPNTTSDIAAGLWEPYLLAENSEEDVIRWSGETFRLVKKLWTEGKAHEAGICLQPIVNLFNSKNYSIPKWVSVTLGYSELSDRHLQTLSKQYGQSFTGGFMFVGFTWEPAIFLPYLQREFVGKKGTITKRRIEGFNELEGFDAVVNCTGFGARFLSADGAVVPFRGQVMRVKMPWQYCTYLVQCDEEKNSCYVILNRDFVVVGGTKQSSFDTTPNKADTNRILRNSLKITPSIKNSVFANEVVGLRPSRYKVRLEQEVVKTANGKFLKVIHNYGHGGAGITLAIGCAKEAAEIVKRVLNIDKPKL
ncbi:D-amino-acid oxidase [Euwallacea similis]|uniref:D-amino-acid oxidase n=1 Tax=Euwallacea similis TaxID=1736056 RepID=UPI00344FFE1F